jgi:hypothetical protein
MADTSTTIVITNVNKTNDDVRDTDVTTLAPYNNLLEWNTKSPARNDLIPPPFCSIVSVVLWLWLVVVVVVVYCEGLTSRNDSKKVPTPVCCSQDDNEGY